jgi:hypothetical protein
MSKVGVISNKLQAVSNIEYKDFTGDEATLNQEINSTLKNYISEHVSPTKLLDGVGTSGTHWAEVYDRRQGRRSKMLYITAATATSLIGTIIWVCAICVKAWDNKDISYLTSAVNIPSYSIMAICVAIGLVLLYIYFKHSSTELLYNIRTASNQINLTTLGTFRLLNDNIIKTNLTDILQIIFNYNSSKKIMMYKPNDTYFPLADLQNEIAKIFDEKDFARIENSDLYTLKIGLNKLNKLLRILLEKKHYSLELVVKNNPNRENSAATLHTSPKTKLVIADILEDIFKKEKLQLSTRI